MAGDELVPAFARLAVEARLSTLGNLPEHGDIQKGWYLATVSGQALYLQTCAVSDASTDPPAVSCTWTRM